MRSFIFISLFFISTGVFSQTTVFSSDPETFLKEIKKYLGDSNPSKTKEFIDVFEPNWLTNFSSEYQRRVIATCNLIRSKNLYAFPDMYGYLLSVHSFVQTNQPKQSFESWHNTIDQLLNSKKVTKFQEFIEVCAGFFTDGTLFEMTAHKWQVTGGTYTFEFNNTNPIIRFENVTMACYIINRDADKKDNPYHDSTIVRGTSGYYEPLITKWTGRGGKVDWQKVGMDPKKNYAIITDYMLSLKSTEIESDSCVTYTEYYETPLAGTFKDDAKKINREVDRNNPQFVSFSKRVVRKSILPEVDYVGGFAIKGASFNGIGYDNEPASLVFYKDGAPFVKASALSMTINEKGAQAVECAVVMYLSEEDSIFHPGLEMRYVISEEGKGIMTLMRSADGLAQAPFKNSYHDLDMYVDELIWDKSDPNLTLSWHKENYLTTRQFARFESQNYFSERVYNQIQGMNAKHPLVAIYQHAYRYDIEVIPVGDASTAMGFTTEQALPIILDLANQGFLTYNKNKKTIVLQPKTKKYIDARAGKTDYDHIVFTSNFVELEYPDTLVEGNPRKIDKVGLKNYQRAKKLNARKKATPNFGTINLKSFDMYLNEVEPIELSPAQHVVVFPDEGHVLLKKNLDFLFSGAVMAGKLEVYLEQGSFDYENFRINLLSVEAALLRVKPIFGGSDKLVPMTSHFEGLKGFISIDDPTNRSGKDQRKFPQYPVLKSKDYSYVFYDHESIYNSVYDSATFYFKADPFELDSLDNFDEYSLQFPGEMRSAGIFPVFRESLKVQEDYSFGFKTKAPTTGFNFYGDYAKFDNEIRLSNEGLRGAGRIDFVTSTSISENFIFFPDSTMGIAQYTNRGQTKSEGISVPDVTGNGVMVTFVPKKEILKARAVSEPLVFFNKEAYMKGITYLTPKGMTGRGLMYFKEAELGSKNFSYERWVINADTADFNLAAIGEPAVNGETPLAFNTSNVNAHVDFETRRGEFRSNSGTEVVEFPKNEYICYMDMFTWLMDNDELELSKDKADVSIDSELDLAGSNFFSVHPDQDSLNFAAPKAKYVLKENTIYCEKVEFIDVADARIYPADKQIVIRKKAEMDPFVDAKIVANFITKFHTITEANVQVLAKKKYKASGKYPYKDSKGTEQIIFFANIAPDTSFQTVAVGTIGQEVNFHLSDRFDFYGTVELKAADQFLTFDGATRINHDCSQFAKNWLKFRTDIDPNNIQIPVSEKMTDLDGNPISVGIVKRNSTSGDPDSTGIYPAFLSALERPADAIIFTSFGVLNYNEEASEFRIASPEKLINRNEKGNYISLHTQSCSMEGDGLVDLAMELPGVEFKSYGTFNYDMSTKITSLNLSGGLNFFYDKKAMEYMSSAITASEGLSGIDWDRTTLSQALKADISEEQADNIKADYTIGGLEKVRIPKELEGYTMYLTNLRFKWSARTNAFVSQPISGIVSLFGVPLLKDFTVRMAVEYYLSGDYGTKMGFYVELPGKDGLPGNMYYYSFQRFKKETKLKVYSTDKTLQSYLGTLKEDKTRGKDFSFEFGAKYAEPLANFKSHWGGQ
jgi:hypothetical protein